MTTTANAGISRSVALKVTPLNHKKTESFIQLYPWKKYILWSTKYGRPNIHTNITERVLFGLEEKENLIICSTYTGYFPPFTSQYGSVYIYLQCLTNNSLACPQHTGNYFILCVTYGYYSQIGSQKKSWIRVLAGELRKLYRIPVHSL